MAHRTSRPFLPHAFMSWTSMAALAAATGCDDGATGTGGAGGATTSSASATASGSTTKGSSVATTSSKASSSSGAPFVCDPPAEPGSLYEKDALLQFEVDPTSMCQYRGQVLLIVDTAAV